MRLAFYLLMILFFSCSPYRGLRKQTFHYINQHQNHSLPVLVPKGYTRSNLEKDSAGNQIQYYFYLNGAQLYFARITGKKEIQPIDTTTNIPRLHPLGGLIYKGMDERERF